MDDRFSSTAAAMGEGRRDCAVRAVAYVTGLSYTDAHALLAKHGRRKGKATNFCRTTVPAVKAMGYDLTEITKGWGPKYEWPWTVDFPRTVKALPLWPSLDPMKRYLVRTSGHILAVVGGKVRDWTDGRRCRIVDIWEVTPTEVHYHMEDLDLAIPGKTCADCA